MLHLKGRMLSLGCWMLGGSAVALNPASVGPHRHAHRQSGPQELAYVITDSGLRGPATIPAGHVVLRLTNETSVYHQIAVMLVPRGRTAEQDMASMRASGQLPRGLQASGGIGPIAPGASASMLMRLSPGHYLVYCQLNARNGDPYFKHGMVTALEMTGEGTARLAYEDATAGMLVTDARWRFGNTTRRGDRRVMYEGRTRMTEVIRGPQTIQIENNGSPTHAFVILKSGDPKAMTAYIAWLDGRGPAPDQVTGIPALPSGGAKVYLRVNLLPGAYIAFCPNYHARSGLRGFQTGEFSQFIVR